MTDRTLGFRKFVKHLMTVAIAALAVGACSSAPDAEKTDSASSTKTAVVEPAAQSRDACTLITRTEADSILGSAVIPTPRSVSSDRSVCDYVPAGGAGATTFESFTLEGQWAGAKESIKTARSSAKTAVNMAGGKQDDVVSEVMGLQRVDGLGDEAYFSRRAMSYVRMGDAMLVFQLAGLDEPAREHFEALARVALGRLK